MKKYTSTLMALLLTATFIGCGSNNDVEVKNDTNTSTDEVLTEETTPPPQEQNQKMPTCYIKKDIPLTENMITVHVGCKNGDIPIDEAKVTLDHTVKPVKYKGVSFSDYIGFRNLQPSTTYKAVLEVLVGGKTIRKSVKIKTREEKKEPTLTPIIHTTPQWKKKVYEVYKGIEDTDNKIDLKLNQEVSSEQGDKITYKVLSNSYKILDERTCLQDHPFVESESIRIDGNNLIVKYSPPCIGIITSVVQAKSVGGVSTATVKVNFKPTLWMPTGNTPPVWTKDTYYKTINENDFGDKIKILQLDNVCNDNDGDRINFKISSIDTSKFVSQG